VVESTGGTEELEDTTTVEVAGGKVGTLSVSLVEDERVRVLVLDVDESVPPDEEDAGGKVGLLTGAVELVETGRLELPVLPMGEFDVVEPAGGTVDDDGTPVDVVNGGKDSVVVGPSSLVELWRVLVLVLEIDDALASDDDTGGRVGELTGPPEEEDAGERVELLTEPSVDEEAGGRVEEVTGPPLLEELGRISVVETTEDVKVMYVVLSSGAEELDKPEEDAEDDGAAVELAVIGLLSVVPLVPGGTELAEDGTETLEEGTETLEEGTETLEEGTETGELDDTEEITEDGTPLVVGTETVDPMLLLATGTVLELPTMVVESVLNTGAVVVTLENVDGPVLEAQPSQTVTVSVTVGGGGQNSGGQ
jgi:hypothetical protein